MEYVYITLCNYTKSSGKGGVEGGLYCGGSMGMK